MDVADSTKRVNVDIIRPMTRHSDFSHCIGFLVYVRAKITRLSALSVSLTRLTYDPLDGQRDLMASLRQQWDQPLSITPGNRCSTVFAFAMGRT